MKNNLLQMSVCSEHCPLLAVRDLYQNQSCHHYMSDFLEALVQATLHCMDRPQCRWLILILHCVFGFGGDPCYICYIKVTIRPAVFWFPPNHVKCESIWREPFTHPEQASHTLHNKYEGTKFYLGHLLYPQNKDHNIL